MKTRPGSARHLRFPCVELVVLTALSACDPPRPPDLVRRAEFGIFFGGQIQERRELPFEIDRAKQTLGFRIEFSEPLPADTAVEWRIERPAKASRSKPARGKPAPDADRRGPVPLGATEVARAGETRFDRTVSFEPGDPLGLWNVRVVVRGKVAIDRPFEVYDPAVRAKALLLDGGS